MLGDYIDRGKNSYQVLCLLSNLDELYPNETIFLRGNHDQMYIDNINRLNGSEVEFWCKSNGGKNTIKSFPISNKNQSLYYKLKSIKKEFTFAELFLNKTKFYHETERYIFVHAGVIPTKEWKMDSDEDVFLWIREEFYQAGNHTGKHVVFGHTQTCTIDMNKFTEDTKDLNKRALEAYLKESAVVYEDKENNYLGIDTGCSSGGVLTGVRLSEEEC